MNIKVGDILDFTYTGTVQVVTLPKGKYTLECWGAQGGYRDSSSYGGNGHVRITVNEVQSLNLPAKISEAWKNSSDAFIKINGSWKNIDSVYAKINGIWKLSS